MARRALGPATLVVVQAVRAAVLEEGRRVAGGPAPEPALLVACSGGADSLALAAGARLVAESLGRSSAAVVVDHGLQPGSADQAERARGQLTGMGYDDAVVRVVGHGPVELGPEAAARHVRYAALEAEARRRTALILLGHTLDDQAETVLLGLARGSGTRSLAGMAGTAAANAPGAVPRLRPLLGLRRACTREACAELGLDPWSDPQNDDPSYARVRVRHRVLPSLEAELGGQVAEALARTAELTRDDADLLDHLAAELLGRALTPPGQALDRADRTDLVGRGQPVDCAVLAPAPAALRSRAIKSWLVRAGALDLGAGHVRAVQALVTDWRGQRWVDVPGLRVRRLDGRLVAEPPA